jgi:GT2 family glycosyltransferase
MSLITACIVLYDNEVELVKSSINSILDTDLEIKLYLIDNTSFDKFRDISHDKRVVYIHNPSNPGFGSSHNIAIFLSIIFSSKYHIVINPDIYFKKGNLEKMKDFMDTDETIGHLMPKILYPDETFQFLCKKNPTIFDLFARGFLPSFIKNLFKQRLDKYEYKNEDLNKIIYDIPYLSGCFMFFRTKYLKEVGFFDDKIFMYLEDADITRRFLNVSKTVYYPDATVYHHFAGLTNKMLKYKFITIQSAFIYFNKWGWFKNIF